MVGPSVSVTYVSKMLSIARLPSIPIFPRSIVRRIRGY